MTFPLTCFGLQEMRRKPEVKHVSRTKGAKSTFKAGIRRLSAPLRRVAAPIVGCFTGSKPGAQSASGLATGQVAHTAPEASKIWCLLPIPRKPADNVNTGIIFLESDTVDRSADSKVLASDASPREGSSPSSFKKEAALDQSSLSTSDLSSHLTPSASFTSPVQSTLHGMIDGAATSATLQRPDSPDIQVMLAEALYRLAKRASEAATDKAAAPGVTPCTDTTDTAYVSRTLTSSSSSNSVSTASAGVVIEASSITVQRFVVDLIVDDLITSMAEEQQEPCSCATQQLVPAADIISSSTSALAALATPNDSCGSDSEPMPFTAPLVSSQLQQDAADALLTQTTAAVGLTDLEQCGLADYVMDELLDEVIAETTHRVEPTKWEVLTPPSPTISSAVTADVHTGEHASSSFAVAVDSPGCSTSGGATNHELPTSSPQSVHTSSSLSLADLSFVALDLGCPTTPAHAFTSQLVDFQLLSPSGRSAVHNLMAEGMSSSQMRQIAQTEDDARAAGRSMGATEGSGWWMDSSAFQDMLKAVPTELAQICWGEWQAGGELGSGPGHRTILSIPPRTANLKPAVLKIATDNGMQESQTEGGVGQEACVLHMCCHPNVVPISLLGLRGPTPPGRPFNPSQVAYFGMPMADMSLRKNMGAEAWGRRGKVGSGYQGPSLFHLVKHAQAILRPLASVHRQGLLHRGLTPDHVLLFGKKDNPEAEMVNFGIGEPQPIKYDVKLSGFGAAAKLNSQGCALQPSPYRCGSGYAPPEAEADAPLTAAADIYQFGGVCYFMAMGRDPPALSAGAEAGELPECVPQQWRVLVRQCRQVDPAQRPTAAQLQLHMLDQLNQIRQAKQAARATPPSTPPPPPSLLAIAMQPYQMATSPRALSPSISAASSFTTSAGSSPDVSMSSPTRPSWLPVMLTNPMYSPSKSPSPPLSDPPIPNTLYSKPAYASSQRECSDARVQSPTTLAKMAASLGSLVRRPGMLPDAAQPQQAAAHVQYSPVSSSSSSSSSSGSGSSFAGRVTNLSTDRLSLRQSFGTVGGASHAEAVGSNNVAQPSLQRHSSGSTSAAESALHRHSLSNSCRGKQSQYTLQLSGLPNAEVHRTPCGGLTAVFTPDWEEVDLGTSLSPTPSATGLLSTPHSGVSHSIKVGRDPAHLVATTAGTGGSRAGPSSPGRRAAPRRDDSALEQGNKGSWLMRTQGKAAALAANVTRKASDVMEQWTDSQLSTRTVWPLVS